MKQIEYNDLITRCENLQAATLKNSQNQKLYSTIKKMLTSTNIFKHLSCEICLNVLVDLQYSLKESKEIYKQLI